MSDRLQTIPARHGTATFVPAGKSIKIINTSGTQVIDTWAFTLHPPAPPRQTSEPSSPEAKTGAQQNDPKSAQTEPEGTKAPALKNKQDTVQKDKQEFEHEKGPSEEKKEGGSASGEGAKKESPEKADDAKPDDAKPEEKPAESTQQPWTWSSYLPSLTYQSKGNGKKEEKAEDGKSDDGKTENSKAKKEKESTENKTAGSGQKEGTAKAWSQYIMSKNTKTKKQAPTKEKTQSSWSAYIPSGQSFSSYIPKGANSALSALAESHSRDPSRTYAEQLYDLSKTPVGAASLSVATGSGTASSVYAAYSAWSKLQDEQRNAPPMEFLSMAHTRAQTKHIRPKVKDTLYSNLRFPLMTVIEDTSPGIHDTLVAACDPQRYHDLGVEKWEEHGSCAENLVLALKEFNEKMGFKGPRAAGADVSINTVPSPLNLFMNIPWQDSGNIEFAEPKCKAGDYIRLRAERDVVVVMSACPQDILVINDKKPTDANFEVDVDDSPNAVRQTTSSTKSAKTTSPTSPRTPYKFAGAEASLAKLRERQQNPQPSKQADSSKPVGEAAAKKPQKSQQSTVPGAEKVTENTAEDGQSPQPKKKPRKLERRGTPTTTATSTSTKSD